MKIEDIKVTMIKTDTKWDKSGNKFLGINGISSPAWGKTDKGTKVNVTIKATPQEFAAYLALIKSMEGEL